MKDIENLIGEYYTWLKDKTSWKAIDEWTEITAPYLDRHNDYIQIYLRKTDDGYFLTDDGATITGLLQEGCELSNPKRKRLLNLVLNGYGVSEENGKLQVRATPNDFALRKHSLLQAMLAVNDMFYLAKSQVASLFFEDVQDYLETWKIRYSERISFTGHSGLTRKFDFLIPKSPQAPERMIKVINVFDRNSTNSIIMDWLDTKDTRPESSEAYAFINDNGKKISSDMLGALKNYDITPALWSERERVREKLVA